MSPTSIALVMFSAVMHASWNALARRTDDPFAFFFTLNLLAVLIWLPIALAAGWNETLSQGDLAIMAASGALQVLYFSFLAAAYRRSGVTIVYPIARGTGVAIVPIAGVLIYGERPSMLGWFGIAATLIGIGIVAGSNWIHWKGFEGDQSQGAILFALSTGLVISTYSLVDKYGVEQVNPVVYGYGLIVAAVAIQVPYVFSRRRDAVKSQFRTNWKAAAAGAVLVLGTYMLVLIALAESNVGYVVPLRETSIVFALILGIFVLHEPISSLRLAAASVVACGAVCIAIGG
jgi:drug/metabolite transporter (DMT)-like permease